MLPLATAVVNRVAEERAQRFLGRELEVLVEGPNPRDPDQVGGRVGGCGVVGGWAGGCGVVGGWAGGWVGGPWIQGHVGSLLRLAQQSPSMPSSTHAAKYWEARAH